MSTGDLVIGDQDQEIVDDSDLRWYRTEIPNMADDELDPYQMRLYVHYKRACGGRRAAWVESVRTTAEITKMSVGKVVSTRDWLHQNGWITATPRDDRDGSYEVRIVNRWPENFARFSPKQSDTACNGVHQVNSGVHGVNGSVHQVNHKKEQLEVTNKNKDHTRAAVPGSNIPLYESEIVTTPARVVKSSPYMPKGLKLAGGHIPAGEGKNPVQVYYERFRPDTDRLTDIQEDDLIKQCPDLNRLREVVIAYSQTGYKSRNVKLILDWYRDGVPEARRNAAGKPGRPTLRETHDQQVRNRFGRQPNPASVSTPAPNREGSDNATNQSDDGDLAALRAQIAGLKSSQPQPNYAAD